jgi:membrane-associated phospholipid phosphatase
MQALVRRPSGAAIALALLLRFPAAAAAQSDSPRYDPAWHGALAASGFVAAGLIVWSEPDDSLACKWCGVNSHGMPEAPRIDRWARSRWRWDNERRAATLSHIGAGSAYAWPLVALTSVHDGTGGEWGRDQLAALSSLGMAQVASDIAKRAFRRARPGVVFDGQSVSRRDDVHSFVSGHTATTFAAVVAAGTIASRRQSSDAPWIWATGVGLASTTGYLRVAGDRHFFTDVLTGAAVGTAVGMLMPRLFDDYGASAAPAQIPTPAIVGLGPAARVSPRGVLPVALQFGAGSRSLGVVGTVGVP